VICTVITSPLIQIRKKRSQRWSAKFGQTDKWKICLRAARVPQIRSDNDETRAVAGFVETAFRFR
jgi:hypothetical protein